MLKRERTGACETFLTIAAAARYLGVSVSTLRNWDRTGKLLAARHPSNRYRLYLRSDMQRFLDGIAPTPPPAGESQSLERTLHVESSP